MPMVYKGKIRTIVWFTGVFIKLAKNSQIKCSDYGLTLEDHYLWRTGPFETKLLET